MAVYPYWCPMTKDQKLNALFYGGILVLIGLSILVLAYGCCREEAAIDREIKRQNQWYIQQPYRIERPEGQRDNTQWIKPVTSGEVGPAV